jgi:cellulose synthase operon protein C
MMTGTQVNRSRRLFRALLIGTMGCLTIGFSANPAQAQRLQRQQPSSARPNANRPPAKLSPADAAKRDIVNLYTDAANYQNGGAYQLAADAWKKLLEKYPDDALASKAHHYLGVCYLQIEKPDYEAAIAAFREALKDKELEVREEALINLGWSLFYTARVDADNVRQDRVKDSLKILTDFLEKYPDGTYADKATFYAAECEYMLGNVQAAATRYRLLVSNPKLSKSSVLPDGLYALGVAYEELKQPKLAAEAYDRFLEQYASHRLTREVKLRKAEYLLSINQPDQAVELLASIADDKSGAMRDYVLYRYGFALAKAGKFDASSQVYKQLSSEYPDSQFSTESNLSAGQALMREKKYDEAQAFFEKLLDKKDDVAAQSAHWLAQIATLQGRDEAVVSIVRDALGWAAESEWRVALQIDLADVLAKTADGADEATSIYESVALEHEDHQAAPRAAYNAAFSALKKGKSDDASKWADLFAKRYPKDPLSAEVALIRAESLLQAGKRADAAAAFEQLSAAYPDSPNKEQWTLRTGTAYFFAENYSKAEPVLNELTKSSETQVRGEALFLLGASAFKQSKFDAAIERLNQSIAIEPAWSGADEAYLILAEAYSKNGDNAQAKTILEQLLSKFPNSPFKTQAQFRLGQLSASAKDYQTALVSYDAVIASQDEPDLIDYARYGKAYVLIQKREFDQAVDLVLDVAGKTSDSSLRIEASLAAAVCLRELNKPSEAVRVLEVVKKDASSLPESSDLIPKLLLELGVSYSQADMLEQASKTLAKLAKDYSSFPDVDTALYEHAWVLKKSGRDDLATATFEQITNRFPTSPLAAEAYYHVGQQNYDKQEFASAVKAYTIAISKTNDDFVREKSLYKLGWTHYQTQNWKEAAKLFGDLAREYPQGDMVVDAVFMQAECEMKQSMYKESLTHYKLAAQLIDDKPSRTADLDPQVVDLIYLHGSQSARELKDWKSVAFFVDGLMKLSPESDFMSLAKFEKAIAMQNQKSYDDAAKLFDEIAESQRNELGARSRFMLGEIAFAKRDFGGAIQQYQKVMYGYGATQAPDDIKNWQARAAIEAGRCSDLLIGDLRGDARIKAIGFAKTFYDFVVKNHAQHELVSVAKDRLDELTKL